MHKYIAEGLGTFCLTYVVSVSLVGNFSVSTAFLAALVLGLFVYTIGHLSGSNINPAITIGLWSIKKLSTKDALGYIISQVIGAVLALVLLNSLFGGATGLHGVQESSWLIGFAELIGTFFFSFGVAAVVSDKVNPMASGLVVGGSLLLGIGIAALTGSNGILNPAVALGINSLNIMYILGPIIGSILGMNAYKNICDHRQVR